MPSASDYEEQWSNVQMGMEKKTTVKKQKVNFGERDGFDWMDSYLLNLKNDEKNDRNESQMDLWFISDDATQK